MTTDILTNFAISVGAAKGAPFIESPDSPRAKTPSPTLRPSPFDAKVGKPKFPAGIRPPVEEVLEGDIDQIGPDEDRDRSTGFTGTRTVLNQYEVEAFGADPVYSSQDFSPKPVSYEIEAIRAGESGLQERPTGIDRVLGPAYVWDDVTGAYQPKNLGVAAGMFPLLGAVSIGGDIFRSQLEDVAAKARINTPGYAVGILKTSDAQGVVHNRLIGMSPGIFGTPRLMGTGIPDDRSIRATLIDQLTNLPQDQKAGAYVPPGTGAMPEGADPSNPTYAGQGQYYSGVGPRPDEGGGPGDPGYVSTPVTSSVSYAEPDPASESMGVGTAGTASSDYGGGSPLGTSRDPGYTGGFRATGGTVGFAEGGTPKKDPIQRTGFVEGPRQEYAKGTTVADTENLRVREGSFVINAPMTEKLQKAGVLPKGNQKRKAAKGGKMMEVALSKGEYVVEPKDVPKFGGYGFLEAVNDMGKPEVERRQAASNGGFIDGYASGDTVLPSILPVSSPARETARQEKIEDLNVVEKQLDLATAYERIKNKFSSVEKANEEVDKIIDELPSEDVLTFMMINEASILGDQGMRASGHVAMNRVESDYKDFVKINNLKDMAKSKIKAGSRQFNVFNISDFRKGLKEITQTEYGQNKYNQIRNIAEDIFYGVDEDNTRGALFFRNPATSTSAEFERKVREGKLIPTLTVKGKKSSQEYYKPIELMSDEDTRYIY